VLLPSPRRAFLHDEAQGKERMMRSEVWIFDNSLSTNRDGFVQSSAPLS
jgi:hypothetical protein